MDSIPDGTWDTCALTASLFARNTSRPVCPVTGTKEPVEASAMQGGLKTLWVTMLYPWSMPLVSIDGFEDVLRSIRSSNRPQQLRTS